MEGIRVYMSNSAIAKDLERLAGELRAKGDPAEAPSDWDQRRGLWRKGMPQPVWQCGACGREYSLLDGTVVFGPNSGCTCPEMPQTIRITRAALMATGMKLEEGRPE